MAPRTCSHPWPASMIARASSRIPRFLLSAIRLRWLLSGGCCSSPEVVVLRHWFLFFGTCSSKVCSSARVRRKLLSAIRLRWLLSGGCCSPGVVVRDSHPVVVLRWLLSFPGSSVLRHSFLLCGSWSLEACTSAVLGALFKSRD